IRNNRPDIFILDKKKNKITLIEVGITSQDSLQIVETEKLRKYDLLGNELGLIYRCSVEIIPYVMTWDGIVTKYHKSHLKRLEIPMNIEVYIQSIVLKMTVETISFDRRRGLESGLNAEESWERASMGNNTPLKEEKREEYGGTTLEEPTNNINEESDLEEETVVVKEESNTMDDATPPKQAKRLTKYGKTWETSHPLSKEVKNNTFKAFCTICNEELSCAHGGISDLKHHASSASHINIIKTKASSALSKFINKPNDAVLEFKISVSFGEITCVYHTVKHGLSYNSMDCGHKLLPTVCSDSKIAQKFSYCFELTKESINEVLKSLKENDSFFSIATDAKNKKNRKMFPYVFVILTYILELRIGFWTFLIKCLPFLQKTNVNFGCNHSIYTKFKELNNSINKLKVDVECLRLNKHVVTRFLTLGPAIQRILKLWPALKSHFQDEDNECPTSLQNIFISEEEENKMLAYFAFLHNVKFVLENTMKKLESHSLTVVEMHVQMNTLFKKIEQRMNDNLSGRQTKKILDLLKQSNVDLAESMKNDFLSFYSNFITYLRKMYDFSAHNMLSNGELLNIHVDEYDFNAIQKWKTVFKPFSKTDVQNIFQIVEFIMSIPSSNCYVERFFSQMSIKWSDVRNRCLFEIIRDELMIMFNFKLDCKSFYQYLKTNKNFLKKLQLSSKYEK
ncbi:hypothetical protein CWI38_1019p0020, partial [Hamiltosporidium tvaerminnensis]